MKTLLKFWAEEQLKTRYDEVCLADAKWTTPTKASGLKCIAYLPIRCPFRKGHGSSERKNLTETMLMVTSLGAVSVFCHHSSCKENIQKLNSLLRAEQWRAWFSDEIEEEPPRVSPEEIQKLREDREKAEEARLEARDVIAKPLGLSELAQLSPSPVGDLTPDEMLQRHFSLFPPEDLLWTGETPYQSKSPRYFATAKSLRSHPPKWAVFLTGSSFKSPDGGRRSENLDKRRFCIFENDKIGKERTAALFRHNEAKGLKLAAVVDSGGKSAHGWVVEDEETGKWRAYFKACGFCSRAMRATQPVRLAGATRKFDDDRKPALQRLLYLNEGVLPWRC